jgi:hypothetical protein
MALRGQPYLPLYVKDFQTDEKLLECSAAATGIYIRLLCIMHQSSEYGTILLKQKDKQNESTCLNFACKLLRFMPYEQDVIFNGLQELVDNDVIQMTSSKLSQKRMVKDNLISVKRAAAGRKGGKKTREIAKAKVQANTEIANEYVHVIDSVTGYETIKSLHGDGTILADDHPPEKLAAFLFDHFKAEYKEKHKVVYRTHTWDERILKKLIETNGFDEVDKALNEYLSINGHKHSIQIFDRHISDGFERLKGKRRPSADEMFKGGK